MAWTAPTTRATGDLITASIWNTDLVDDLKALFGVTGIIPAAGTTATAGTGFTYTHTNTTGIYVFTFDTAFPATPLILLSADDNGSYTRANVTYFSASTTGFSVRTVTSGGVADVPFNFLARPVG